jgi:prepilin-type N-terminal cleavage/methylation domain-containing protein
MSGKSGKSNRRGFTLTEVLAVVAVLAIVAALAIPAVVKNWRSAKLTKWDETAREIFLSAQNETSEIKAAGLLQEMVQSESNTATTTTTVQLTSSSENAEAYFPQTRTLLSTAGGSYVLDLNLLTGDVEDVYYSESEGLTPSDIDTMKNGLENSASIASVKNDAVRYAAGIGYYGGAGSSAGADGDSSAVQPECTVVNKEDLYVKLTVPGLDNSVVENPKLISASVKVQGESHTVNSVAKRASQTFTAGGSEQLSETNKNLIASTDAVGTYTLYLLLDSMTDGKSFAGLCPDLVPGDDLTLSLTLKVNGRTIISDRSFAQVNSLFAAKTAESGAVTATYGYVRQLHNLAAYCNVSDTKRESMSGTAVTLRQMQDVDFAALSDKQQLDDGLIMPGNTAATSYAAASVTGAVSGVTLDGGGYVLKNFKITSDYGYAGLIGSCSLPLKLQNLRVADAAVSGVYGAGTLAGMTQKDTQVSNCRVYLTQHTDMSGWMTDHAVTYDTEFAGTAILGGLVGHSAAGTLTIENSCAAVPVTSNYIAGGLVGVSQQSVSVNNSYSSTSVKAKTIAAGFVGKVYKTANITNSFTTASVLSSDTGTSAMAAEFATASSVAITLKNCTAYGLVSTKGTVTYGPLASGSSILPDATCVGLYQSGNTSVSAAYESSVTKKEFSELKTTGSGKTYPYLSTGTFPFTFLTYSLNGKTVTMPYYGDWPEEIKPVSSNTPYGLCYYEQYSDGTWGFYGYSKSGNLIDTLDYKNAKTITSAYGYGVAAPAGTANVTGPSIDSGNAVKLDGKMTISSQTTDLYPWSSAKSDLRIWSGSALRVIKDTFAGRSVYMNPCFGGAFSLKNVSISQLKSNPILQIRTTGHLDNIDDTSTYSGQFYLRQTHNITADSDTGMIDGNSHQFTYDGDNYKITGLKKPLFNVLGTTTSVQNILLDEVDISGLSYTAGPLAAIARFEVINCRVISGSIVSTTGNNGAAGLIGVTDSSAYIVNCFSANCRVASKNGYAGGLICNAQGAIIKCYANNTVETTSPSAAGSAAGFIADSQASIFSCFSCGTVAAGTNGTAVGFCNTYSYDTGRLYHCYSVARITGGKYQYGFKNLSGRTAEECYWAKQGTYNSNATTGTGYGTVVSFRQMKKLNDITSNWLWDQGTAVVGSYYDDWTLTTTAAQTHPASTSLSGKAYPYPLMIPNMEFYGDWPDPTLNGSIGAYWYSTSQTSNINGESIDLSGSGEDQIYTNPGDVAGYGILINDAVKADASNWKVKFNYTYLYDYFSASQTYTLTDFMAATSSRNEQSNLNFYYFTQYVWWSYIFKYEITVNSFSFTYVPTGETYTFSNSNGTFTYTS